MFNPKGRATARVLVAATAAATFLATPHAYAIENVAREARHFFECLGLLLTDPDLHAQECLPNSHVPGPMILLKDGTGPAIVPPPPPPPPPPTCPCGPCYGV
jgi:hypothetical protein